MKIVSVRVMGFQSFLDTGNIEFSDGINLIVGQNNSGKSALLRAMLLRIPDDRHRTPAKWEDFRLPHPKVTFTVDASGVEIRDWILRSGNQHHVPMPPTLSDPVKFADEFLARPNVSIFISRTSNSEFFSTYPSHRLFDPSNNPRAAVLTPREGELNIALRTDPVDSLPQVIWAAWQHEMFYFAPERMTVGESSHGHAERLRPDASNLPNVLHTLSNERGNLFEQLIEHLREIFPTVGNLSVRTRPDNQYLQVRVWPTEEMERLELSFPLNSSGTGVSQVIALLTAIMTVENAVILIDEINSFLHPAAVKALLRILQTTYAQHQYIISTHAPEVIGFSNPKTIHLVSRRGYESSVKRLDLASLNTFREVAEHLGVSMADVFAADKVIWVEGPTEELCFPYLYQQFGNAVPRGTLFTSVSATGDFNAKRRDRELVFEVYKRLSAAAATLVVSVAFSFDTEKLRPEEKAEMVRESGGLLHFLPRRHLECYLIDPSAIAALIVTKDRESSGRVTPDTVKAALVSAASGRPFHIPQWNGDLSNPSWLENVDAANLIANVCTTLSDQRATFAKTTDSLFLMQQILAKNRELLEPLYEYVAGLVGAVAK